MYGLCACVCMYVYVRVYVCMCVCMCMCVFRVYNNNVYSIVADGQYNTHTYTHTHMHTHTHTHTHTARGDVYTWGSAETQQLGIYTISAHP